MSKGRLKTSPGTTGFQYSESMVPASRGPSDRLVLGVETDSDSLGHDQAMRLVAERGWTYCASDNWETDSKLDSKDWDLPVLYNRIYITPGKPRWQRMTWVDDDRIIDIIARASGQSSFTCYSSDEATVLTTIEDAKAKYPPISPEGDDHIIDMHFWSLASSGPNLTRRKIAVPKWGEIDSNYSSATHAGIDKMMDSEFRPESLISGQLLLWYGPPGTGKTYAIRALANEWRSWCDFEYVVDPEKFFGMEASYLMSVIVGKEQYHDLDDDDEADKPSRWRTLIFEDTGELLSADAKERSGQGLSRLLNLVDGIIGQGLRILVLITTNEDIGKFHPAVARPGRISASIRFSELDKAESVKWAATHGLTIEKRSHTIAELFDESKGSAIRVAPEPIKTGFHPSRGTE